MQELRELSDLFEQVQQLRIQSGERLRAKLQGRDGGPGQNPVDAASELAKMRKRSASQCRPTEPISAVYVSQWKTERELHASMETVLEGHPAWEWLKGVRGIGPALGCRLLGRLDFERAKRPSSFWAYCGLSTLRANMFACPDCGRELRLPVGMKASVRHRTEQGERCGGRYAPCANANDNVRCAPVARRGTRLTFDPEARRACYLIGVSLLRTRSEYAAIYYAERERLTEARSWSKGHTHQAALRRMVKQLLLDLWIAWSDAVSTSNGSARATGHARP